MNNYKFKYIISELKNNPELIEDVYNFLFFKDDEVVFNLLTNELKKINKNWELILNSKILNEFIKGRKRKWK